MDHRRFDAVTRSLITASSRRTLLRNLVSLGLGVGVARIPGAVGAGKKRKRKKKKPKRAKPNAIGCLSVGKTCKNAGQCCSGICEGKKGKRRCRSHDTGTCRQDGLSVCTGSVPALSSCNNTLECACIRTTADSNYCAALFTPTGSRCADCRTDADCVAQGLPVGSACAPISEGFCAGICPAGMACLVPCGTVLPEPEPEPEPEP